MSDSLPYGLCNHCHSRLPLVGRFCAVCYINGLPKGVWMGSDKSHCWNAEKQLFFPLSTRMIANRIKRG